MRDPDAFPSSQAAGDEPDRAPLTYLPPAPQPAKDTKDPRKKLLKMIVVGLTVDFIFESSHVIKGEGRDVIDLISYATPPLHNEIESCCPNGAESIQFSLVIRWSFTKCLVWLGIHAGSDQVVRGKKHREKRQKCFY